MVGQSGGRVSRELLHGATQRRPTPPGNPVMSIGERSIALGEEVRISIDLFDHGLGELQRIDEGNDFYHPAFLLLSMGLERLMKCVLCLRHFEKRRTYPSNSRLKALGHNLEVLLENVVSECFDSEYRASRPAADQDAKELEDNPRFRALLTVLSGFGRTSRYYNLDVVSGREIQEEAPEQQWQSLESEILRDHPLLFKRMVEDPGGVEVYSKINSVIVAEFEKVARALCRLFTLGPLGGEGKRLTGYIAPFLFLTDDRLGKREYPVRLAR